MAVSLKKGGNVSLTKTTPGLTAIIVGLGWDVRKTDGAAFDLDASAFMLDENDKAVGEGADGFVFYNQKTSKDGSTVYGGDNRTGEGEGDDESVNIDLTKVDPAVKKIAIVVTIDEWEARGQNFGMVSKAYVRAVNSGDNAEIARYDLSEDASTETAMVLGEIYRGSEAGEWKFKAIGQGFAGGLAALAKSYGIDIG